jgi:hypothetical protein
MTAENELEFFQAALAEAGYPEARLSVYDDTPDHAIVIHSPTLEHRRAFHRAVLLYFPDEYPRCYECWDQLMTCTIHSSREETI